MEARKIKKPEEMLPKKSPCYHLENCLPGPANLPVIFAHDNLTSGYGTETFLAQYIRLLLVKTGFNIYREANE